LIETFINVILRYFKISINCPKRTDGFSQLIELIIKSFDQLKSVKNFGQLIMKVSIN
jgi:hypothetical protein